MLKKYEKCGVFSFNRNAPLDMGQAKQTPHLLFQHLDNKKGFFFQRNRRIFNAHNFPDLSKSTDVLGLVHNKIAHLHIFKVLLNGILNSPPSRFWGQALDEKEFPLRCELGLFASTIGLKFFSSGMWPSSAPRLHDLQNYRIEYKSNFLKMYGTVRYCMAVNGTC
jgi:hypothetical protein